MKKYRCFLDFTFELDFGVVLDTELLHVLTYMSSNSIEPAGICDIAIFEA